MAGPLNMSNNKITHLGNATSGKDGVSRDFGDGRYVKKSGDTMTGTLSVPNISTSLNCLTKRNKVMNYYSLLNHFFLRYGGRLTNRGVSDGCIYIISILLVIQIQKVTHMLCRGVILMHVIID